MKDMKRKPRGFYDKDRYSEDRLMEFLEGRRRRLGLTQTDMGAVIGISQQSYGNRVHPEKGRGHFDFLELVKIFKFLKLTDEEILMLMKQD